MFSIQIARGQITSLTIGDPVALAIPVALTNFPKSKSTMDRFSAELMVIDFYNTHCSSCIAAFPKNNKLQQRYGNRLRILPVTYEDKKKVDDFNKKNDYMKGNALPIIIKDKTLSAMFPHRGVPHLVWIWKGIVVAITNGDMLTEDNVDYVLSGRSVADWPRKDDFFNYENQEFLRDSALYSKFYAYQNGAKLNYLIDTIGDKLRIKFTNVYPQPLFTFLYGKMAPGMPFMKKKERLVLNVKDRSTFERDTTIPYSLWLQEHAFCYESTWPLGMEEKVLMSKIVNDIGNRLSLEVLYTKQKARVWVIKGLNEKSPSINQSNEKGAVLQSLLVWKGFLEIMQEAFPPILIDGVESEMKITIFSSMMVNDFASMKKMLNLNGLDLVEEEREIEVLVFEDQ